MTDPEQPLDDWLVGEFRRAYDVPEKLARYWLAHDELALLLDGLEEVRADRRADVVATIHRYRSEHLAPWRVLCCRKDEYAQLSAAGSALEDVDAVLIQPLTPDRIKDDLADLEGPEPRRLWRALRGDTALLEVADTPLMLNVMLLTAGALDWDALPARRTTEAVRSHIYDAYIRSMLDRPRQAAAHCPQDKTLQWLHWLAGRMVAHGQAVFMLERMNRSWFNRPWQRNLWVPIFVLIFGLIFGLIGGLLIGLGDIDVPKQIRFKFDRGRLIGARRFGLIGGLIGGLMFGLLGGLLCGLLGGLDFGWEAATKHYTLRLVLWIDGSMLLNYVRFLDYCADRVFVRRGGGGYIFIHRTFMEHVAALDPEALQRFSKS